MMFAMRMFHLGWLAAILLSSCAGPTLKDYEDRAERGRARLEAIAKSEYERDRANQDSLLIYAALAGGKASAQIDRIRGDLGPVASFLVGRAVLCGLPLEQRMLPPPEAAQEVLRAMDKAAPRSSLVPLYRLQWLKVSTTGDRSFWRECKAILQDALTRDQWDSPIRGFYVKWFTWLDANESDDLVKLSCDLRISDGYFLTLLWLARLIAAVHVAPVPPDSLTLEVSKLFRRVCERLQESTKEALDFTVAGVSLQILLPARFLALWKVGDVAAAEEVAAALDEQIFRDTRERVFNRRQTERYEAYPFFWRLGLDRLDEALLPTIVAMRRSPFGGKAENPFEYDEEGLLEGFRCLDAGGRDLLKNWREDLGASMPILTRVLATSPGNPPSTNALRWALRDKALIDGQPFPADRQIDLLKYAFDLHPTSEETPGGIYTYRWLLKDALLRPDSVPLEVLKSLKVSRVDESFDHFMILHKRGEPMNKGESEDAIRRAKDLAMASTMKGYCQLLALWAKEDRTAAAAMLPDYERGSFQDGWAVIGETLRHVTGQDFGYDLGAWKKWLLAPSEK